MNRKKLKSVVDSFTKNTKPSSIYIIKASGVAFFDQKGRKYLDFSSQTLNLNLGQNHPNIVKAVVDQSKELTFVSSRFIYKPLLYLANELLSIAPKDLSKINLKLVNGSDANESAFKRARKYHQKPFIISFYKSHLGESGETLSASGKHFKKGYLGGSGNFLYINPPIKSVYKKSQDECDKKSLGELTSVLNGRKDIAGIIIEPVMVNAGGYVLSKSFLKKVRKICHQHKICLIFDEIQTAFAWLGHFFASDYFQVIPDMISLGKALSSGFPLAALLIKEKYDVLDYGEDEYSYGGHPASCAAALANIRYLKRTDVLKKVEEKGKYMLQYLSSLQDKYEAISAVRGAGLILAVEFDSKGKKDGLFARRVYDECLKNGLVLRKCEDGKGNSLVFKPPLIVSKKQIDEAVNIFSAALETVYNN